MVLVRAQKPDRIGGQTRGLGRAGDQDGRFVRLGRKQRFVQRVGQRVEKFLPGNAAAIESQGAASLSSFFPAVGGLIFGA
jgi:hypothetical protein